MLNYLLITWFNLDGIIFVPFVLNTSYTDINKWGSYSNLHALLTNAVLNNKP